MTTRDPRPLICHVVYRFDVGGLENGVVNLINRLPEAAWRHQILALTEVADGFRRRIQRDDVDYVALAKPPGHLVRLFPALHARFRDDGPLIVHTRNLAALEAAAPAWSAGVPVRIHGEHGRDARDPDGQRRRYRVVRRAYSPFVSRYVAVSRDLERYLVERVGVAASRVVHLCNGVDTERFRVRRFDDRLPAGCPFDRTRHWLVGTVGRMDPVKDQVNLARAFVAALREAPAGGASACASCSPATARCGPRSSAWSTRPACADSSGLPASGPTFLTCCGNSTASCCRRWVRASRTPSSKRWRPACRSSRRASAATPNW